MSAWRTALDVAIVAAGSGGFFLGRRPRKIKVRRCCDEYCKSPAWPQCDDDRCRYHCDYRCRCQKS